MTARLFRWPEGAAIVIASLTGLSFGVTLVQDATPSAVGTPAVADLFLPIARVLTHPRCINCHTVTDYPRQGDDRHRHLFLVVRGTDNRGATGARCTVCHQTQNQRASGVPGGRTWQLAPLTMAWESGPGVAMAPRALCRRLLDKAHNGGRDLAKLEEHMAIEPLVLWAWNPGTNSKQEARDIPPLSHEAFMQTLRAWVAAGAPCPG